MTSRKKRTAKRIVRDLTPQEAARLGGARQEAEARRDEILRQGRVAKQAWLAMRREVDEVISQLRAERQRLGLSLADIESRSGLRRSSLSRLENDKNANPTLLTLQRYAAALGVILSTKLTSQQE